MAESDSRLLRRALEGDSEAYGDLVERYVAHLHGIIREIVRQPDVVEDLVQDVLCTTYEQLATLRDPKRFAAWLRTVAVNRAHDWLRRRQTVRDPEMRERVAQLYRPSTRPDEVVARQEQEEALWEALDRLAPELRRVLVLRYLEDCTVPSMARFLGVSGTTVKLRLFRARGILKDELLAGYLASDRKEAAERRRRLKRAIMAGLPMVPFWSRPAEAAWLSRWWGRLAVVAGGLTLAGLLGVGLAHRIAALNQEERYGAGGGLPARLGEVELPEWSVVTRPAAPQPGEGVHVAARSAAGMEGPTPTLHWVTGPFDEDHVTEMAAEGDEWVASVEAPAKAQALFVYISSSEREPIAFDREWYQNPRLQQQMRKYSHPIPLRRKDGQPVRGAQATLGRMATLTDTSLATALAHYEAETRLYPDNLSAYGERWNLLARSDTSRAWREEVAGEAERLAREYPDSTRLVFWELVAGEVEPPEGYRRMVARGAPPVERQWLARSAARELFYQRGERAEAVAILEQELALAAGDTTSRGLLIDYLELAAKAEPDRALAVADSIAEGAWAGRPAFYGRPNVYGQAATLGGLALITRLEVFRSLGDAGAVRREAERVAALEPGDPLACLYAGQVLAGRVPEWRGPDTLVRTGEDADAAIRLFRLGLAGCVEPWSGRLAGALHEELGRSYLQQGRATEAAEHAAAAVRVQEGLPWYEREQGPYLAMGEALQALGRWREAREAYLEAMEPMVTDAQAEAEVGRMSRLMPASEGQATELPAGVYPQVGELRLRDLGGQEVSLSPSPGPLLLYYDWPLRGAPLDAGAREYLAEWHERYAPQGVRLVVVAGGVLGAVEYRRKLEADPVPYPVAVDDGRVYEALQPRPATLYVLDPQGRIRLRTPTTRRWDQVGELVERCLAAAARPE